MYDTDTLLKELEMEDRVTGEMLATEPEASPETATRTILLVEDEELIRRSVSRILAGHGYRVMEAENGAVALSMLREEPASLIMSDLRMPEMDGFALLEKVGNEMPQIPVIIFSGVGTKPDIISALRLGAWDYIMKPIQDIDYLIETIEKVVAQSEMSHGYQDMMEKALCNKNRALEEELRKRKILENQLLHAKREWEKTVDSIPEAIALVDKNSLLIRVNMAMANLLEEHPARVVGRKCFLSTRGLDNKQQAIADFTAILRGNNLRGRFTAEDGSGTFEVTISPYYDHDDRTVIGAVYVARNIDE